MSDMASPKTGSTRWRLVAVLIIVVVLAGIAVGVGIMYMAVSMSLEAEERLHATLFTIRLVEQFVSEQGRWPKSWGELEKVPFSNDPPMPLRNDISVIAIGGHRGFDWPACSRDIQRLVAIDFIADPQTIVEQSPSDFSAIKPRGAHYEYRHYGFVESLQTTIRLSINEGSHQ